MELKAEQLALQKEASKGQRVTCPVCNKPAVMYMDKKRGVINYEHRDEPPTREYTYGKTGQKYYRYRRCYGGRIGKSLAEIIEEGADEPKQEEQGQEQTTRAMMPSTQQTVDKQLVECGKCHGRKNPGMTTYHVYENGHQVWKHLDKITSYSTYPDGTKRPNYARCVIKHRIRNKGQEAQPKQKQEPKRGRGRPRLDYKSLYVKEKAKVQKLRRTLQQMQDMGQSALEWS